MLVSYGYTSLWNCISSHISCLSKPCEAIKTLHLGNVNILASMELNETELQTDDAILPSKAMSKLTNSQKIAVVCIHMTHENFSFI